MTPDGARVVSHKSPWSYCWSFVALAVWLLASVVLYLGIEDAAVRIVVVVVSALTLVVVIRAFLSSVTIEPHRLVVRGVLRTRTIEWSEIDAIDVGSKRLSGTGSHAFLIRYRRSGEASSIKPTLHGSTPKGRVAIGELLTEFERATSGHEVTVSRSDPWNAGTSFPV